MADGATISISSAVWSKRLASYLALTKRSLQSVMAEEWPLLMRKIIDFTPPFKTKGLPGASDLSVGRKAVSHDIYKTMRPFDPAAVRSKAVLRIIESRDTEAFNIVARRSKDPRLSGAQAIAFSPTVHTSQRDFRGRVNGRDRNRVVLGSDAKALKSYVTKVQSRVGIAKSGWAPGYNLVRSQDGAQLPAYITRQGSNFGAVIDGRADEFNPSITAINRSPWSVRHDEGDRIRADAYFSRINALKTKMQTYVRLNRQNSGFHGAAAAA